MNNNFIRHSVFIILLIMLATMPLAATGCEEEIIPPPAQLPGAELSSTLVPNMDMDIDIYVYAKQEKPTTVPKDIIGMPSDVTVESLALWGVPTENNLIFGGGLTFTGTTDPAEIQAQIPGQAATWTSLADRNIYFVQGSGAVADTLKSAISQNDFRNYDDQAALTEVALLPDEDTTKLAAVGIVKPSQELRQLITKNITPEYASMIDLLLTWGNLQVIVAGLYAPQQIEVAEIAQGIEQGSIWEMNVGILASIKSVLPGFVVSPIVDNFIDNFGYAETSLGDIKVYKSSIYTDNGKAIPILIRVEGNRIFAAISGQESYAETLITSINF